MKIQELMGENAESAKKALKIISLTDPSHQEGLSELVQMLDEENPIEVLKGLCSVISLVCSHLNKQGSPQAVFDTIRGSTDEASDAGADTTRNYAALDLLDATTSSSAIFYLRAYSLEEPAQEIVALTTLFQTLMTSLPPEDKEELVEHLLECIA